MVELSIIIIGIVDEIEITNMIAIEITIGIGTTDTIANRRLMAM